MLWNWEKTFLGREQFKSNQDLDCINQRNEFCLDYHMPKQLLRLGCVFNENMFNCVLMDFNIDKIDRM